MEETLKLYDEKISIMREMLRVTSNTKIEGIMDNADEEAEDYVALMEKRKGFLEKILVIDEKIENSGYYFDIEIVREKQETVNLIARELLNIDQKHAQIAPELMTHIKKNIKEINNGKNLNQLYQSSEFISDGSPLFDQRK